MKAKQIPTQSELIALFEYKCGELVWKRREASSKGDNIFNSRFAGKSAGWVANHGYVMVTIGKKGYLAHRLIWQLIHGDCPAEIDHINHDKTDNRIENLRPATREQNMANQRGVSTAGFKGVTKKGDRYQAKITARGKGRCLGTYDTPEEAHEAYMAAAVEKWGEFATGNLK